MSEQNLVTRKRIRTLIVMFLCAIGMVCCNSRQVFAEMSNDGFEYRVLDDGTVEIESYYGTGASYNVLDDGTVEITYGTVESELVIPGNIDGKPVTSIRNNAFWGCSELTSIKIPESVTSIGNDAFDGCSGLTSIKVAEGNSCYNSAGNCNAIIETETNILVKGCNSTKIPEGVTEIGNSAFADCSELTSIEIPESVTSIGDRAFSGCSELTSIEIPESVTSIGYSAFVSCSGLTSIEIPKSVTTIESFAFLNCSGLTSIEIPESVTSIGEYTFWGCSGLISIKVAEGNPCYNSAGDCNAVIETKTNRLVSGCRTTKIPEGVTGIGNGAFAGCSELTSIKISESVTSIESYVFFGCSELTSIEIPKNVTSIGECAFAGCSSLASIKVAEGNPCYNSAGDCNAIIETKTNILVSGCRATKIPDGVTSIGEKAFSCCSSVYVSSENGTRGYTFFGSSGLTSIEIPKSVTSIGDGAFLGCPETMIVYADENSAAAKLTEEGFTVKPISEAPSSNGNSENSGNNGTTTNQPTTQTPTVDQPTSDQTATTETPSNSGNGGNTTEQPAAQAPTTQQPATGQQAVNQQAAGQSTTDQPAATTETTTVGTKVTLSSGKYEVTKSDNTGKEVTFIAPKSNKKNAVTIPATVIINGDTYKVTAISNKAFKGNKKLKSVTIGKNVTKIGKEVFSNCKNLKKITIKSAVLKSIGKNALKGINKKAVIRVPSKQYTKYKKLFKSMTGYKKTMVIKKN